MAEAKRGITGRLRNIIACAILAVGIGGVIGGVYQGTYALMAASRGNTTLDPNRFDAWPVVFFGGWAVMIGGASVADYDEDQKRRSAKDSPRALPVAEGPGPKPGLGDLSASAAFDAAVSPAGEASGGKTPQAVPVLKL